MTGGKTRGVRLFFQKHRVLLGLGLPLTVFAVLAILIVNDNNCSLCARTEDKRLFPHGFF